MVWVLCRAYQAAVRDTRTHTHSCIKTKRVYIVRIIDSMQAQDQQTQPRHQGTRIPRSHRHMRRIRIHTYSILMSWPQPTTPPPPSPSFAFATKQQKPTHMRIVPCRTLCHATPCHEQDKSQISSRKKRLISQEISSQIQRPSPNPGPTGIYSVTC